MDARVIRIASSGADDLRRAIENGIIQADMAELVKKVVRENDRMKHENSVLSRKLTNAQEELAAVKGTVRQLRRVVVDGYKCALDSQVENRTTRSWRLMTMMLAGCIGGIITMLMTVAVVLCNGV